MHPVLATFTAALTLLASSSLAAAAPAAQATACPVASNDLVSTAIGQSAQLFDPDFGVAQDGTNTECLFSAGDNLVLVRLVGKYFSPDAGVAPTVQQIEELRLLVNDELDYAPVSGVGDAALWATVRDRSLASQRMGVLISKFGSDALIVGMMESPTALSTVTTLTESIAANRTP